MVSYLRLPWDDVGRAAAQLLWERKTGRLAGQAAQRLVPMQLIPRLTCHRKRSSRLVVPKTVYTEPQLTTAGA